MHHKKILWALFCGLMAMTVACSSDDPASNNPSGPEGGDGGGGGTVSPVSLAGGANKDAAAAVYNSWHNFHFVSKDAEAAYYPSIAPDYPYVFKDNSPVGRVIWSQQTGYYREVCAVEDATRPEMKYRGCTVSEGIGYGMLLTYFQGDEESFKSLWNYSRGMRAYFATPFTPWITYGFSPQQIDVSSATDADLDIATSLILMHYKTGVQEYLDDALTIVNAIWQEEIQQPNLLILSGNTSMWTMDPTYNLSYFSPVALRLFAAVDPSHDWNGVLNAMYAYMKQVQDAGTGVFPDWSDANGAAKDSPNGSSKQTYWKFDKESVRIPWRIAWDYYWYQDDRAKAILDKLNEFIVGKSGGDPSSIALGTNYSWNLTAGPDKEGNAVPSQWLAAWCLTGISGNTAWLNACTDLVNTRMPSNSATSYFPDILLGMYSQLLNGLYVRPF